MQRSVRMRLSSLSGVGVEVAVTGQAQQLLSQSQKTQGLCTHPSVHVAQALPADTNDGMGGVCVRQMKFPVAHSTTLVWNGLFEQAMTDGASYFLTCHDDTEFYPMTGKYWSDVLVGASRQSSAPHLRVPQFCVGFPQSILTAPSTCVKADPPLRRRRLVFNHPVEYGSSVGGVSLDWCCRQERSVGLWATNSVAAESRRELHPPAAEEKTTANQGGVANCRQRRWRRMRCGPTWVWRAH